jgi:hypothetical protein
VHVGFRPANVRVRVIEAERAGSVRAGSVREGSVAGDVISFTGRSNGLWVIPVERLV